MDVSTDTRQVTRLRLEIFIKDINDNPPRFENTLYETTVDQENTQGKKNNNNNIYVHIII